MHNAIAHHPLTDALRVPKSLRCGCLPSQLPTVFQDFMCTMSYEMAFAQFWSALLVLSPPKSLCPSALIFCQDGMRSFCNLRSGDLEFTCKVNTELTSVKLFQQNLSHALLTMFWLVLKNA